MKCFAMFFMFLATSAWAQKLEYKTSEFLKEEVLTVLHLLPSNYLDSVRSKITIQEVGLKSDVNISQDLCHMGESVQFGLTNKYTITVSAKLVQLAQNNSKAFDCSHGSFRKLLQAVIIHELTHVKDNVEKISTDPDFQRIVGVKRVGRSGKKKLMSKNVQTSPDAYEFKNLEESLAVNTEYLVLDPEFECRKPATANFLSQKLGIPLKGECEANTKVMVQSAYLEDNFLLATDIHASRIYQIHYLFAGKGKALMSRWGHAMFRLVICAPYRKKVGPECIDDVSHHVVLSYRAYMSDMDLSYSKGLLGKYPSQLFIMRFLEVQQEYTKFDLRDLYSVPLKMTTAQKKDFIDLTLERYWTYQGKYYFLDNNCGTEGQKHLAVALSNEQSDLVGSITPLKIYKDIIKSQNDLTEGDISRLSREEMKTQHVLIESVYGDLKATYDFLRPYLKSLQVKSFDTFLNKSSAQARNEDYRNLLFIMNSISSRNLRQQLVMKVVYLERYLSSRFLMDLPKKAFEKMQKDPALKKQVELMGQNLQSMNLQPWDITQAEYGAPLKEEFETHYSLFKEERMKSVQDSMEAQLVTLQNILGAKYFTKEILEIEILKKNKMLMNELLKMTNEY